MLEVFLTLLSAPLLYIVLIAFFVTVDGQEIRVHIYFIRWWYFW